jgi:hypothetical protein
MPSVPITESTTASSNLPQDFGHLLMLEDYMPIPEPIPVIKPCAVCHAPDAESRCSKCKNIRYCSTACQSLDWGRNHQLVCKRYIDARSHRPCPNSRRVMFFPTGVTKPFFLHLLFGDKGEVWGMEQFFKGVPEGELKKLSFHNRNVPFFIQLNYDTNPHGKRELADNMSLGKPFRGPVVVLAYDPETALSAPALDVDITIMGPLMEFIKLLREYDGPVFIEVRHHD